MVVRLSLRPCGAEGLDTTRVMWRDMRACAVKAFKILLAFKEHTRSCCLGVVFAMFHFVCVFFLNSDDSHVLRCLFVVFVMLSCQKSRLIAVFGRSNEVGIVGPIIRVLLPS